MTNWQAGAGETVISVLTEAVAAHSDRAYLDFSGDVYTYREIDAASTALAHGLSALGVAKGDTVASILDNSADAVIAWLAINKLGAISVPVNTAYKGEFLRHQIFDSGAQVVLSEADYVTRIVAIADGLPAVKSLLYRGEARVAPCTGITAAPLSQAMRHPGAACFPELEPGDLSMLIYTSGTTGPSKGCMISHGYACNLARQSLRTTGLHAGDVLWTPLPLFHMNATATAVLATAMIGIRGSIYPRFSLSNFWPEIERSGATAVSLLGSMHPLIAEAPDSDAARRCYGQVRVVAAAPFPKALQDKWRLRFGAQVMGAPGYGFTEAAMVAYGPMAERLDPDSSGPMAKEFDVIIVDDQENPVPVGQSGEVLCRPRRPFVQFDGYWNRPADTLKIMKNLWLHTGDIGKFGDNGEFYFLDRKKDYLRRRGENISSFEMETTYQSHPAVMDVAVHAVFSELGEDDVKVTCVLKDGAQLTEEELCAWSLDKVPYFAVPRFIEFRRDLPRNPTGKVLKYQLREEGKTPGTWDREKSGFQMVRR